MHPPIVEQGMNPKHRGDYQERRAHLWMLELGYEVYDNVSSKGAVDFIAMHPKTGDVLHIDVKSTQSVRCFLLVG